MLSAPVDFEGSRFASMSAMLSTEQSSSSGNSCGSRFELWPMGLHALPRGGYCRLKQPKKKSLIKVALP